MKHQFLAAALVAILGISLTSIAAPDEAQRQATQRAMAAKATLHQAQAAKGAARTKLMG